MTKQGDTGERRRSRRLRRASRVAILRRSWTFSGPRRVLRQALGAHLLQARAQALGRVRRDGGQLTAC